jgi:hypothetical protein
MRAGMPWQARDRPGAPGAEWIGGARLGDAGGDLDQRSEGLDELELPHGGHQRQVAAVLRDLSPRVREARSMASGVPSIFTRRRLDRLVGQE